MLMKQGLPIALSFNGGYVDTVGFLALKGLFTAHVTGNFVTLGSTFVLGTTGAISKLLALPVFCVAVVLTRMLANRLTAAGRPVFKLMLVVQIALLGSASAIALCFGPFGDPDSVVAVTAGMTLVGAMAIQNAAHRLYLASAPPSTLMTGTTTQIMIDLVDLVHVGGSGPASEVGLRVRRMVASVAAFALGCAAAAVLYWLFEVRSWVVPPLAACVALVLTRHEPVSP
jgi:uncharacterized membrane protein YoaK (UPF0700 family)